LIIFEYTGLFWAALLGWALFDEVPRLQIFMGAGIIIGACLFASLHERRAAQILRQKSAA
jgi:S-adenosylmethionine uptake transporter|tara:strand:+ start:81064 stop:81243 length:180 start_codon:yes stop_codon:yes gene_type:complete